MWATPTEIVVKVLLMWVIYGAKHWPADDQRYIDNCLIKLAGFIQDNHARDDIMFFPAWFLVIMSEKRKISFIPYVRKDDNPPNLPQIVHLLISNSINSSFRKHIIDVLRRRKSKKYSSIGSLYIFQYVYILKVYIKNNRVIFEFKCDF